MPGLRELPRELDSHSPPIFIPGALAYGNEIVKSVHVSDFIIESRYVMSIRHVLRGMQDLLVACSVARMGLPSPTEEAKFIEM